MYGQRVSNTRRDLVYGVNTLLANSTSTNYTATGLSAGSFYLFTVTSVSITGTTNSIQFTYQTVSQSADSNLSPGSTSM